MAQYLAQSGDFSGFEGLGLTPAQIENMRRAYQANFTKPSVSAKTGGKTSGKEIDKKIDDKPTNNYSEAYDIAQNLANSGGDSELKVATFIVENENLTPEEKDEILTSLGISSGVLSRIGEY